MNFVSASETDQTANTMPSYEILVPETPDEGIPDINQQLANQQLGIKTEPGNRLCRITGPIKQDLNEIDKKRRPIVLLKVLGATAMIAANVAHVRAFATPLEMDVAEATSPFAVVLLSAGIHVSWFGAYSHALRNVYKEMPHTLVAAGKKLSVDKLNLPGLDPEEKQTDKDADISNTSRNHLQSFKRRSGRAAIMQGTPTITYITAAASQGQTDRQQKELCNQTAVDGALGSIGKGIFIAGALTAISIFDAAAVKDYYDFGRTLEGVAVMNGLPMALFSASRVVKKLAQKPNVLVNELDDSATDNSLPVVDNSRLTSRQSALLVQ